MDSIDLSDKTVTGDKTVEQVMRLQAKLASQSEVIKALNADRSQLLEEYEEIRKRRAVPRQAEPKRKPKADSVRISAGDVHGMMMDKKAVAAFLADLRVFEPDQIVLGGDITECGGWLAKHQPVGFIALCDYSYQEDINAANWFLDQVQEICPEAEIIFFEGNHEDRVERWCVDQTMAHKRDAEFLRQAFAPSSLLRLEERNIKYIRRSEVYGEGLPRGWLQIGDMYYVHELGKSQNAARQAAQKTAGNVTYFHTHREDSATIVFPGVGMVRAFCPGCLSQMQPIWKHSDPTSWSQGYAVDFVAKSGNFQHVHVPIWRGSSLASSMVERFKS